MPSKFRQIVNLIYHYFRSALTMTAVLAIEPGVCVVAVNQVPVSFYTLQNVYQILDVMMAGIFSLTSCLLC